MNNECAKVIPLTRDAETAVRNARIVDVDGRKATIALESGRFSARVAFSCLVDPAPGDLVMCVHVESGEYYVLGIIERPGRQNMTLSMPEDATIRAGEGSLNILSGKNITVASAGRLSCLSDEVVHKSRSAVMDFDEITARSENVRADFKIVHVISEMITTMAKQIVEAVKYYTRHTEKYDQVNAGQMTRKVGGLYSMDSKYTVMVSARDTKIDGERIHMG